jgi:hypothetical protein
MIAPKGQRKERLALRGVHFLSIQVDRIIESGELEALLKRS